MYRYTTTYKDYNDFERTEDFFFNLNKAEIMEMQFTTEGGLEQRLKRIMAANDVPTLVAIFKDLLLRSYGIKSDDGRHFLKSEEIRIKFECSPVYSELFMKLATDDVEAAKFINQVVPSDVAKEVFKDEDLQKLLTAAGSNDKVTAGVVEMSPASST